MNEREVDALLADHVPELLRYVRRHAGRLVAAKESAEDVVQSACREVLHHLDRFQHGGEEGFRRWLFAMTLRKLRNRQRYYATRKRAAAQVVAADTRAPADAARLSALLAAAGTPSADAVRHEEVARLEAVLAALPERYRQVVTLAYLDGRSHGEIAAELGISVANARVILSRALARLATLLRSGGPPPTGLG